MIIGTNLRRGLLLAYKKRPVVRIGTACGGGGGTSSSDAAAAATAPFSTALVRLLESSSSSSSSSSSADRMRIIAHPPPTIVVRGAADRRPSFSSSSRCATGMAPSSTMASSSSAPPPVRETTMDPSLRAAIAADLRSVDADADGRIGAEELGALLRKHESAFAEGEILELSDLFYSSLGGSSVSISKFLEALDAASGGGGGGDGAAIDGGSLNALGLDGKLKTHPLGIGTCASEYMFAKSHGKYSEEDLDIEISHREPVTFSDKTAFFAVKCVRLVFDTATLWNFGSVTKEKILNRAIFLETIAAIPGMVAAIIRHFRSLRNMTRDGGMLNMFLEEANNERMHLLTFIRMKDPGYAFRAAVIGAQFGFGGFFLISYMINPAWCHRFVGYVEEEACHTYTKILREMEVAPQGSELARWKEEEAPKIAKGYWHLGEDGTVFDVMRVVRADEAEHRDVNHAVSGVPDDMVNPLYDPRQKLDVMLKKYVEDMMEKEARKHERVV